MTSDEEKIYNSKRYVVKYRIRYMKISDLHIGNVFYHDLDTLIADAKMFVDEIKDDKIIAQHISKDKNGDYFNNVRSYYDINDMVIVRAEVVDKIKNVPIV